MKPAVPHFVSRLSRLLCSTPSLRSRRAKSVWSMPSSVTAEVLESRQLLTVNLVNAGSIDGGDGIDTCTSPAAWVKVSC